MDGMRVGRGGDELLHRPHHAVLANAVDRDLVAGVYAAAYKALATPVYSSAVFNFIPKTAMEFYQAVASDDTATQHRLLKSFFMPYLAIRNRVEGYRVSIIKAGHASWAMTADRCGHRWWTSSPARWKSSRR